MHWLTKSNDSIVIATVSQVWAARVYANNPPLNSYSLGCCHIPHWGSRKYSKCYFVWMKNTDVPNKWQWQKGSHFRYTDSSDWQRGSYSRALWLLHPGFVGRKQGRVTKWGTPVCSPCHSRCDPSRGAVELIQVCRWPEQSPVPIEGCFPLPTALRCCIISFISLPDPKFCVVPRKWLVRGREQEGEEMSHGGRWQLSPVAAAPWAPWAIQGQVGLEWRQELCWESHRERGTIGFPPVPSTKLQMDQSLGYPVSGGKSCELKLTEQMPSNSHCH